VSKLIVRLPDKRGLSVLELLAGSRSGLTLPEISKYSGRPKSWVHCILLTLEFRPYLHRNDRTSRYMFDAAVQPGQHVH
jgi:DNA-binding IclR family transcriptional regulator